MNIGHVTHAIRLNDTEMMYLVVVVDDARVLQRIEDSLSKIVYVLDHDSLRNEKIDGDGHWGLSLKERVACLLSHESGRHRFPIEVSLAPLRPLGALRHTSVGHDRPFEDYVNS